MILAASAIVPLSEVVLYALLNPALIAVAFALGRKADQPAKLGLAAFAGAAAGFALLYVAALFGVFHAPQADRAAGGIFMLSMVTGTFYAWAGWRFARSTKA